LHLYIGRLFAWNIIFFESQSSPGISYLKVHQEVVERKRPAELEACDAIGYNI
jgi:hypothetical protein